MGQVNERTYNVSRLYGMASLCLILSVFHSVEIMLTRRLTLPMDSYV